MAESTRPCAHDTHCCGGAATHDDAAPVTTVTDTHDGMTYALTPEYVAGIFGLPPHILSRHCWCKPTVEAVAPPEEFSEISVQTQSYPVRGKHSSVTVTLADLGWRLNSRQVDGPDLPDLPPVPADVRIRLFFDTASEAVCAAIASCEAIDAWVEAQMPAVEAYWTALHAAGLYESDDEARERAMAASEAAEMDAATRR